MYEMPKDVPSFGSGNGTTSSGPTLYCGDPHGRFGHIVEAAVATKASAVVLLGDMESPRSLDVELEVLSKLSVDICWIPGNHDSDSEKSWCNLWESGLAERNIHGRVVTLPDGTRLAGLGGIFRESVWYPRRNEAQAGAAWSTRAAHSRQTPGRDGWREGPPLRHWTSIYPEDAARLEVLRADVLVTHEAPSYHPHGFAEIDRLARAMGAKATVHGHHHDRLDSAHLWTAQGFSSHGVGLRGITAVDAEGHATVVVPGELDEHRLLRTAPRGTAAAP